jgi:IS30 family transposase
MNTEDRMPINERYQYLRRMKPRYQRADRSERGVLLDEMETFTGLHRKSLLRLIHSSLERKPRSRQRGRTYGEDITQAVRVIAESLDDPCAERLQPRLAWMAEHLAAHGEMELSEALLQQLETISVSTVQRRLTTICQDEPRIRRSSRKQPNSALQGVPMGRIAWDVPEPGHFETDLVHHSGASSSGLYTHTLQMVDVKTGWTARRAVLGRSYVVMEDAFHSILKELPLSVREIHPDNGSEFFNDHLRRFWKEKYQEVHLSRSRPGHKNDNPFVEQRNGNPVRVYLGDDRYDTVEQTRAINALYDLMRVYHNFFLPVMRVAEKQVLSEEGQPTRIRRRYDCARPPLDRLCETNALSTEQQERLLALRRQTNPRQLLAQIRQQLDYIYSLPNAREGEPQVVYDTLSEIPDPRPQAAQAR